MLECLIKEPVNDDRFKSTNAYIYIKLEKLSQVQTLRQFEGVKRNQYANSNSKLVVKNTT